MLIYRPAEDAPSAAFAFPLLLLSIAEPGDNIEGLRRSIRWWWAGELDEEGLEITIMIAVTITSKSGNG